MTNSVNLQFNNGQGSQTFTDTGTAASGWFPSGPAVIQSTVHNFGSVSSLLLPSQDDYLLSFANGNNRLPATAAFSMTWKGWFTTRSTASSVGGSILSIQGAAATAAATQFLIGTSPAGMMRFVYSDGTTRFVVDSTTLLPIGVETDFEFRRVSGTLSLRAAGVVVASAAFAGSLNQPGPNWRIGASESNTNSGYQNSYWIDSVSLSDTIPVDPITDIPGNAYALVWNDSPFVATTKVPRVAPRTLTVDETAIMNQLYPKPPYGFTVWNTATGAAKP